MSSAFNSGIANRINPNAKFKEYREENAPKIHTTISVAASKRLLIPMTILKALPLYLNCLSGSLFVKVAIFEN